MSACMRDVSTRTPRSTRARSAGRCCAPRSNSSAYAPTALTGVRSSCDASATKRRRRSSDACCLAKASSMRSSIVFSAMPSRPTSVRSSACSTRRLSSPPAMFAAVLSMLRRGRKPDSHQPEAEPDCAEEDGGGDEDLGQQQPVQRRVHVVERQRDHQQRVVRQPLRPDAELAVVAAGGVDREERCAFIAVRGEARHLLREARPRRRELPPGRLAHDGRAVRGAQLDVGAGRRCRQRARVTAGTAIRRAEERADERSVRGGEALVDAVDEERPQRGVRGDVGGHQADERDGGDCDAGGGPATTASRPRPPQASGSRNAYPTSRIVWMSGGPSRSSFFRK